MKAYLLAVALLMNLDAQQAVKVQGKVVNSVTQEPLNGVTIGLMIQGRTYAAETANGGQFSFTQVVPGKYLVMAQRDGYHREIKEGESQQIQIDQDLAFTVRMEPLCAISGKIVDSDGDPIRNSNVSALRYSYVAGKRLLSPVGNGASDDRGEYRIFGLLPGKYYIRANSNSEGPVRQHTTMHAPTYYPNTTESSDAGTVNLAAGGEAGGIDITLRSMPVFKVRGTLPSWEKREDAPNLRLMPNQTQSSQAAFNLLINEEHGAMIFEFSDVPAGSYILAGTRHENSHTLYTRENVQVSGANVEGISPRFLPAFDVTGKVVFEGAPGKFDGMRVRLGGRGAIPLGPVKTDGTFTIRDVSPEIFTLNLNNPDSTYLKSIQVGKKAQVGTEVDFTHGPAELTLVLASDFGSIKGSVKNDKGEALPRVRVTAIPDSRFVTTDANGNFEITKLPPGEYKLFAWDKVETGAPQDPDFRKPYEKQGREVHVASNGRETADLIVVHVLEQ